MKGYLYAAIAAAAYGTNPAFAIPLYEQGMNANSVLLFRYIMGLPLLAVLIKMRGRSLMLKKNEIGPVLILGVLMAFSSLCLFESYNYMNSGVASALLFVYPVMVAVMMIFFFHEKFKVNTAICLILMAIGVVMLIKPGDNTTVSTIGCLLTMLSALTYALYLVMVNVSDSIRSIPTTKLMFYVLMFGSLVYVAMIPCGNTLTLPQNSICWVNLTALAIIPTILSLALTTRAIQLVGSTPTAILGALEPVSAIVLSVVVLNQSITATQLGGCGFIVLATILVISDNAVGKILLHVRKMFPKKVRK